MQFGGLRAGNGAGSFLLNYYLHFNTVISVFYKICILKKHYIISIVL